MCVQQTNSGTGLSVAGERVLRDEVEFVWTFLNVMMPSWAETEVYVTMVRLIYSMCIYGHVYLGMYICMSVDVYVYMWVYVYMYV